MTEQTVRGGNPSLELTIGMPSRRGEEKMGGRRLSNERARLPLTPLSGPLPLVLPSPKLHCFADLPLAPDLLPAHF